MSGRCGIRRRRSGSDELQGVAGSIADDEGDDARRRRQLRQSPALEKRGVASHGVDVGRRAAVAVEKASHDVLLFDGDRRTRGGEEPGSAAGNQDD